MSLPTLTPASSPATAPYLCRAERKTMMQPELIPVPDRYGECENGSSCPGVRQIIKRKPMFVVAGLRLCKECTRKVQS